MNTCEEVCSGRIDTPYHHNGPFADERARTWPISSSVVGHARQ